MKNILLALLLSSTLIANEETSEKTDKISEALGHLLGKHLEQLDVPIDLKALAKGMKDQAAGIEAPLGEEDCLKEIAKIQEKKHQELEKKNLIEAENFLTTNQQKEQIKTLIEGKLQMEVVRQGSGEPLQLDQSPVIRFSGHYINGESFLDEENETLISLDEASEVFQVGLAGMLEGEVRTLYVHPTLGFNDLEPSALQIFEVELVRVDAGADEQIALESFDTNSLQ